MEATCTSYMSFDLHWTTRTLCYIPAEVKTSDPTYLLSQRHAIAKTVQLSSQLQIFVCLEKYFGVGDVK
jgi:hypothetical protein